jgi:hypothetical protein
MNTGLGEKLLREDTEVLAIPVGVSRNEFVLTKLAELRKIPAQIIRNGEFTEWRFEGVLKHQGRLYLHGPYLGGVFLEEVIQKSFPAALPYLNRLIRALETLQRQGRILEFIQTDSVYFLEDGGILFLPPALMRELRSMHPEPYKLQVYETINHPDIEEPEKSLSFSVAALLYRTILGRYPFEADKEEEIHNLVRHARLLAPNLIEPGLREDLSREILRGLNRGQEPAPSLKQWREILTRCKQEGVYRDITEMEREQIQRKGQAERRKIDQGYRRKVFWQRHWKTVVIVSAVVVVVGALAGSLLKTVLAPRATRGFSPQAVVETYYRSMNDMNHTLMEDCVVDGAGKETIREVVNIYVLSRVSLGYEGRSHIIPADDWDAQGRPDLSAPQTVYGITDLELQQERGEPEPVFRVRYTRWIPEPAEESPPNSSQATGLGFTSSEIEERVFLRLDRKDWVIYRFEPL